MLTKEKKIYILKIGVLNVCRTMYSVVIYNRDVTRHSNNIKFNAIQRLNNKDINADVLQYTNITNRVLLEQYRIGKDNRIIS